MIKTLEASQIAGWMDSHQSSWCHTGVLLLGQWYVDCGCVSGCWSSGSHHAQYSESDEAHGQRLSLCLLTKQEGCIWAEVIHTQTSEVCLWDQTKTVSVMKSFNSLLLTAFIDFRLKFFHGKTEKTWTLSFSKKRPMWFLCQTVAESTQPGSGWYVFSYVGLMLTWFVSVIFTHYFH